MDMAVANLLKHKIRFERYGSGYGNVIYYSSKIENLESIGARSLYDLCLNRLQSFFIHVLSTIIHECPHTISHTEIKAKVIQARGGYEEDLIGFTIVVYKGGYWRIPLKQTSPFIISPPRLTLHK